MKAHTIAISRHATSKDLGQAHDWRGNWRSWRVCLSLITLCSAVWRRCRSTLPTKLFREWEPQKYGFAIHLHESMDINCSQLLVCVHLTQNNAMKTELLVSQELSGTMKGKDIFSVLDSFKQNELDWGKLFRWTTDGALSILGWKWFSSPCESCVTKH